MSRLTTCSLLLLLVVALAWAAPITHDEALAKIAEWGPDKTADKIVALDSILQATPLVTLPQEVFLLVGRDLVITRDPKFITVDVAPSISLLGEVEKPWIHYEIVLEDRTVRNFVPPPDWLGNIAIGVGVFGLGAAVGAILVALLN